MAPIHDTDVAKTRWEQAQWRNFELWEKLEQREIRNRKLWILATVITFFLLSSVPVFYDRIPKWESRRHARELADRLVNMKARAATSHFSYRFRINNAKSLSFHIEQVLSCRQQNGKVVEQGILGGSSGDVILVSGDGAQSLNLNHSVVEFCYDFALGSGKQLKGENPAAFIFMPAKDLTEKRLDRVSVVQISGVDARITFN